ncbi:MAG: ABC-2 transporter permease [Clostridiales bacterium]|nr:ABC-2 transporter permease [Clostridiales bacterium]
MKGLLLKDLYMAVKYCRAYLLIAVVFLAVSFAGQGGFFVMFYPCIFAGMIPVTLLGYDERSKWHVYSGALPYTRGEIVSAKYLVSLIVQCAMILLTAAVHTLRLSLSGSFVPQNLFALLSVLSAMSLVSSSLTLPFMFRFGVEKGRIAYYVTVGIFCGCSAAMTSVVGADLAMDLSFGNAFALLLPAAAGIYALSWYLSILFYKKREF